MANLLETRIEEITKIVYNMYTVYCANNTTVLKKSKRREYL